MRPAAILVAAVALLTAATAAGAREDVSAAAEGAPDRDAGGRDIAYRIGPEDVLKINVWENEALNVSVPVRPDGRISLPLLNDVQAAGLTPLELRERLTARLAEYVDSPEVVVIVSEVHSFKVSVLGEVERPGRYELGSRVTVLDVLALAGGFTDFAKRSRIGVLRDDGSGSRYLRFDYDEAASGHRRQANFTLQPGDIVVVP
jgi:polysaccharide export outer membrane protein